MAPPVDPTAYLAAIVASSEDAIVSKDLDGIITSWNHAAEQMFGYSAAEALGRSIRIIIPADRQHEEDRVLAAIRSGSTVTHFETVRQRKNGELFDISLTVSPIHDASGKVIGASKIARDISDRKRAEAALARLSTERADLEQRLLALVAASGSLLGSPRVDDVLAATVGLAGALVAADGYAVWRLEDGRWKVQSHVGISSEFASEAIAVYRGQPAGAVESADPLIATDVATAPMLDERREAYRAEGIRSMLAIPLSVRGGRTGALAFYFRAPHAFTDVEIKTAQALGNLAAAAITTAELYDEVRRANRLKDDFLATLSHELRTPLNAIMGYARMLRTGALGVDRQLRAIETVERNAAWLAQMVEDVLDVSRITSGKLQLHVAPVALGRIVADAVATVSPAANAKGVHLEMAVAPDASALHADADRLQQVLWNLLTNAVKFTGRGGRVEIRARRSDEAHVEVTVSDTGIGIQPAFLPFVFDRFTQADSRFSREHGGLGLGLAIARHIVEMHGGTIAAESEGPDRGATFRVRLPTSGAAANDTALPPAADSVETDAALHGVTVLAVDDDHDALSLIRDILAGAGARVLTAASGSEALTLLERDVPDAIVSDIGMPGMDGLELLRRIRTHPDPAVAAVPAAALTAYARSDDRMFARGAGFQLHLPKPMDPVTVVDAIASLVRPVPGDARHVG